MRLIRKKEVKRSVLKNIEAGTVFIFCESTIKHKFLGLNNKNEAIYIYLAEYLNEEWYSIEYFCEPNLEKEIYTIKPRNPNIKNN